MISIVIPVFNEEENIPLLYQRISTVVQSDRSDYEILFVNDGSTDNSGAILKEFADKDAHVKIIFLSRNFSHQAALSAGLRYAKGDCVFTLDADMQDPPELLPQFLEKWRQGFAIVYSVRSKREEGFFKQAAYKVFYKMLGWISDFDIPPDSGDFCLMDKKVVRVINEQMPEQIRFIRGLRTFSGFRQTALTYERPARTHGKPKYTFAKLFKLAVDGLFDFSTFPLRVATYLGVFIAVASFMIGIFFLLHRLIGFRFLGHTPEETPGLATLAVGLFFLAGIMLIILGIIGEYIGRIYYEVKRRPTYIVDKIYPETK